MWSPAVLVRESLDNVRADRWRAALLISLFALVVVCHGDGTTPLPRPRDHLGPLEADRRR